MVRIKRLLFGEIYLACHTKRRLKWFSDTSCCSFSCLWDALHRD